MKEVKLRDIADVFSGLSYRRYLEDNGNELAKANDLFIEEIQAASTTEALKAIWTQMKETGYLNYKIDITSIDSNATDFEALCIEDQKRFLIECLDKNLLYVPFSDIDSEEYAISDEDKRLTKEFYKKN